jgi:hypothetical protein
MFKNYKPAQDVLNKEQNPKECDATEVQLLFCRPAHKIQNETCTMFQSCKLVI